MGRLLVLWIIFILIVALFGCASTEHQRLQPGVFYKRDARFIVDSQEFLGVATLSEKPKYDITFLPRSNSSTAILKTCHRSCTIEKRDGEWSSSCGGYKIENGRPVWWNPVSGGQKNFIYSYLPIREVEVDRVCPLQIAFFDATNGQHSWIFIDFQNSKYQAKTQVVCDGNVQDAVGVFACQAQAEATQMIRSEVPLRFATPMPSGCYPVKRVVDHYEVKASNGKCLYQFDTKDGKLGRFVLLGYQGIKLGEPK